MEPPRIWRKGELCRVTYAGRTVDALVEVGSQNGASIGVTFEAILGGFAGVISAYWDERDGCYRDLMFSHRVELSPRQGGTVPSA